jgi:hypothetical protein
MASDQDKEKMKVIFDQYDKMEDATEIKNQIAKLKRIFYFVYFHYFRPY